MLAALQQLLLRALSDLVPATLPVVVAQSLLAPFVA